MLPLAEDGILHEPTGLRGFEMDLGQCGIQELGEGYFYIAHPYRITEPEKRQGATLHLYRYTGEGETGFSRVE